MKKLIALLVAATMVLTFAVTAFAEEPAEAPYAGEELTISFSSTYSETETGGEIIQWFKDYLEEKTEGKIKVNVTFGGTLFGNEDQLDGVADGAVNMIALAHNPHADMVPLLCSIPDFAPESTENALNYFDYLLFENEETAALLQAEAESIGVKYLNVLAGGANTFISKEEFTELQDLIDKSKSFGNMEAAKFEALGLTVEAVLPWDYYNAFETGLIDASQMSSTPLVSMSIYEVAPYWMYDNTYTAGNFFTVNLDWWNGLSAEAQAAIEDAAKATEEYSCETYDNAIEAEQQFLVENGATLVEMSEEDSAFWWSDVMESKKADSLAIAEGNDNVEDVMTILNAAAEFTGYEFAE